MKAKDKMKKVTSVVNEIQADPDYEAVFECPHCNQKQRKEVFDENVTIKYTCWGCRKEFKVKIPKFN